MQSLRRADSVPAEAGQRQHGPTPKDDVRGWQSHIHQKTHLCISCWHQKRSPECRGWSLRIKRSGPHAAPGPTPSHVQSPLPPSRWAGVICTSTSESLNEHFSSSIIGRDVQLSAGKTKQVAPAGPSGRHGLPPSSVQSSTQEPGRCSFWSVMRQRMSRELHRCNSRQLGKK